MENLAASLQNLQIYKKDHETVRKAAPKLQDTPQYSVSHQYSVEISDRRKELYS